MAFIDFLNHHITGTQQTFTTITSLVFAIVVFQHLFHIKKLSGERMKLHRELLQILLKNGTAKILSPKDKVKIHKPAGHCASLILSFLFSKKAFLENFAQTIADMRDEANEADALNQSWQRRWIIIRGNISLIISVVIYLKVQVIKKAWNAFSINTPK